MNHLLFVGRGGGNGVDDKLFFHLRTGGKKFSIFRPKEKLFSEYLTDTYRSIVHQIPRGKKFMNGGKHVIFSSTPPHKNRRTYEYLTFEWYVKKPDG